MAWAIRFDGTNQYASFLPVNRADASWRIEMRLANRDVSVPQFYVAGKSSNQADRILVWYGAAVDRVTYRTDATNVELTTFTKVTQDNDFHDWVIVDDGTDMSLSTDGSPPRVQSGQGGRGFNEIEFFARMQSTYSEMDLEYFRYYDTSSGSDVLIHDWDATNSDHNSLTLTDFGSAANDASLVNMTTANWIDLGGDTSGIGESTGSSTASAVGASTYSVSGLSEGQSTASAVSKSEQIVSGVGESLGQSTASATGRATHAAIGESSGISVVIGVGESTVSASGLGEGQSTAQGLSDATAIVPGVGESQGGSAASAIGKSIIATIGESVGESSATATGASFYSFVGESVGNSSAMATSSAIASSVGIAQGSSAASAASNGEISVIVGLTLELSSDIITLELSSEQEIRELA